MDIVTIPAYHTANSYTTFADADSYISSYSRASYNWGLLSKSKKKYALILAAQTLNTFSYRGLPITKNQILAFPRYTPDQLKEGSSFCDRYNRTTNRVYCVSTNKTYSPLTGTYKAPYEQLDTFYDIEYTQIVEEGDFVIEDNKIISAGSDAAFYTAFDGEDLLLNQVIRVSGISQTGYDYLTVIDIDPEGEWIQVKETLTDDAAIVLDIWGTDIFGVPKNVEYAQIEMAAQVVNTKMFQQEIGENPEPPIQSFSLIGALSVRYVTEITRRSKFEDSGPLDIIYNLLNPWMAGVKGAVV